MNQIPQLPNKIQTPLDKNKNKKKYISIDNIPKRASVVIRLLRYQLPRGSQGATDTYYTAFYKLIQQFNGLLKKHFDKL